jgi:hypothetical protein
MQTQFLDLPAEIRNIIYSFYFASLFKGELWPKRHINDDGSNAALLELLDNPAPEERERIKNTVSDRKLKDMIISNSDNVNADQDITLNIAPESDIEQTQIPLDRNNQFLLDFLNSEAARIGTDLSDRDLDSPYPFNCSEESPSGATPKEKHDEETQGTNWISVEQLFRGCAALYLTNKQIKEEASAVFFQEYLSQLYLEYESIIHFSRFRKMIPREQWHKIRGKLELTYNSETVSYPIRDLLVMVAATAGYTD